MQSVGLRTYTGKECREAFHSAFGPEVQLALVRQVVSHSRTAVEIYDSLDVGARQRLGTLAGFRRSLIETGMKQVKERYQLDHALDLKAGRGAAVLLLSGDVALTLRYGSISATSYSATLARSDMPDLYGKDPNPVPELEDLLYGILRYRLSRRDPSEVTSVQVVFPSPDMKIMVDALDLLPLHYAALQAEQQAEVERDLAEQEQKARVKPRKGARKDRKEA